MQYLIHILIFVLGISFGSFANVLLLRLSSAYKSQRSKCLYCAQVLSPKELIPVLSFILQKGRCKRCQSKLSYQYIAVELLIGFLFLLIYLLYGFLDLYLFLLWALAFLAVLLSVFDIKHHVAPTSFQIALLFVVFLLFVADIFSYPLSPVELIVHRLLSALLFSSIFFFVWLFSRGHAMGFADVKVSFILGFLLSWGQATDAAFLTFILGARFSVPVFLYLKYKTKSDPSHNIALLPFIFLAFFIVFFSDFSLLNI